MERVYADASLDQSLARLQTQLLASVDVAELRAAYQARKLRAKLRANQIRQAFDDKVSRLNSYLGGASSSSAAGAVTAVAPATVGEAVAVAAQRDQQPAAVMMAASSGAMVTEAVQRSGGVVSTSAGGGAGASAMELETIFGSDGLLRVSQSGVPARSCWPVCHTARYGFGPHTLASDTWCAGSVSIPHTHIRTTARRPACTWTPV